jgi:hypothetical protein
VSEWIAARPQDFARGFRTCWQGWLEKEGKAGVETKN